MAVYAYKARDSKHATVRGTIAADTPRQARDLLRARGLAILDVSGQPGAALPVSVGREDDHRPTTSPGAFTWGQRVSPVHVVGFMRELSTLLAVGIPMLEAISTIAKQHRGHFAEVLLAMHDRIHSGSSLAQAMRDHPHVFDELSTHMVQVGEDSGTVEASLDRLAKFKDRSMRWKNHVASALLYPGMVVITGLAVSVFLMTVVVPNLLEMLAETGKPLPWATWVVKGVSDTFVHGWWAILLALGVVGVTMVRIRRSPGGRAWCDRLILKMPMLGPLVCKQAISRIATVLSTLMKNGIVFEQAVRIAGPATRNVILQDALSQCDKAVRAGQDIAEALDQTGAFPPLVVRIFAAGQQSGRLEEMLDRLAEDYDQQVATASHRLATVLEPILILCLAILVGIIAFATLLPILEAGDVF